MKDAFSPKADFSGMTGNRDLFLSAVIHKAFVEDSMHSQKVEQKPSAERLNPQPLAPEANALSS